MNDNTWTWISGSNVVNVPGVYGDKGVVSAEYGPGARWQAAGWFDESKNEFWVFGGYEGAWK